MCGNYNPHTRLQQVRHIVNDDICFAFNNLSKSIKRGCLLRQPLPIVKGHYADVPGRFPDNGFADYGIGYIFNDLHDNMRPGLLQFDGILFLFVSRVVCFVNSVYGIRAVGSEIYL